MGYSSDFKTLEKRFKTLRSHFIPRKFDPTGTYTKVTQDKARAFRLLIHAEIEYYFEKRALDIATAAFDKWKTGLEASSPLVHLICNVVGDQKGLPNKIGTGLTALTLVGKCFGQFRHTVETNNGLKTQNIMELLLPIAVLESELDPVWLSTLDGFAAQRGESAHKSSVTYQIDPQSDLNTLILIVDGVRSIDLILNKLAKSVK